MVDMDSEIAKLYFQNLDYLIPSDYEKAASLLKQPADYNFFEILNW